MRTIAFLTLIRPHQALFTIILYLISIGIQAGEQTANLKTIPLRQNVPFFKQLTKASPPKTNVNLGIPLQPYLTTEGQTVFMKLNGDHHFLVASNSQEFQESEAFDWKANRAVGIKINDTIERAEGALPLKIIGLWHPESKKQIISSNAASIASYLVWYQRTYNTPLFLRPRFTSKTLLYALLEKTIDADKNTIKSIKQKISTAHKNASDAGIISYRKESLTAKEDSQSNSLAQLRRKHLANPISPDDRYYALIDEYSHAQKKLGRNVTDGQVDAYSFERWYMGKRLSESLTKFFHSRGLVAELEISGLPPKEYPFLAVSDKENCLLVLGDVQFIRGNAYIIASPSSVTPTLLGYYDYMKKRTGKTKDELIEKPTEMDSAEIKDGIAHLNKTRASLKIAFDTEITDYHHLHIGTALVSSDLFTGWRYLRIKKETIGKNWWYQEKPE